MNYSFSHSLTVGFSCASFSLPHHRHPQSYIWTDKSAGEEIFLSVCRASLDHSVLYATATSANTATVTATNTSSVNTTSKLKSQSLSLPQHYHPHYPKYFNQSSTPLLQSTQYNQQVLHLLYFINQLYVSTVRAILPVRTSPCFLTLNPECTFCPTFDQIIRTLPRSLLLILTPIVSEVTLTTQFYDQWNRLLAFV